MNQANGHLIQIGLVLEVDARFRRYEIELESDRARAAAEALGLPRMAAYITEAAALLAGRGEIRIGKIRDVHNVVIDLFRGTIEEAAKLASDLELLADRMGAAKTGTEEGVNEIVVRSDWE